jgi:hypothetical protein
VCECLDVVLTKYVSNTASTANTDNANKAFTACFKTQALIPKTKDAFNTSETSSDAESGSRKLISRSALVWTLLLSVLFHLVYNSIQFSDTQAYVGSSNIIQRALALRDRLWLCFIPDGVHVDFFALGNYLRAAGLERSIFVTDAISAARLGPGNYTLAGWDIVIGEDLVARSPDGSHFVGSTVTVPRIQANALGPLALSQNELRTLLDTNPRRALGLS